MPNAPKSIKPIKAQRPGATARGYNYQHQQWRKMILMRHPICDHAGCYQRATEADHIVPISKGGKRFDLDNGQGLCHKHHSEKTWRENHNAK